MPSTRVTEVQFTHWPHATIRHLLAVALLVGTAIVASAAPKDKSVFATRTLFEFMGYQNQLFIGTVMTIAPVHYTGGGPCSAGATPFDAREITVNVQEVLHGGGISPEQALRTVAVAEQLNPGDHVICYGTRSCADDWRLWGGASRIGADGSLNGGLGIHNLAKKWRVQTGHKPNLSELRNFEATHESSLATGPFVRLAALDLVRVSARTSLPGGGERLKCEPISRVFGAGPPPAMVTIREAASAPCMETIAVGDTIIVPLQQGHGSTERVLNACPDFLHVNHGYLPGLGVTVAEVAAAFAHTTSGFELKAMRKNGDPR